MRSYKSRAAPKVRHPGDRATIAHRSEQGGGHAKMDGYSTLAASSPPAPAPAVGGAGCKTRRSLELTNTKETKAWEGLAIGAVTLARTFSTGSHVFCRSGSRRRGSGGGVPGALRRAFSMRRLPAGPGVGDGYWRIHDMDGDSDGGDCNAVEEVAEQEEEEQKKDEEPREEDGSSAAAKEEQAEEGRRRKKRVGILKACKKLLRL
ncbi:hypothetical protein ACP70R_035425 [Stipagrostis hirtigluma subsp. patula]